MKVVKEVQTSPRWYATLFSPTPALGGEAYQQLLSDGPLILHLRNLDIEDELGKFWDETTPI